MDFSRTTRFGSFGATGLLYIEWEKQGILSSEYSGDPPVSFQPGTVRGLSRSAATRVAKGATRANRLLLSREWVCCTNLSKCDSWGPFFQTCSTCQEGSNAIYQKRTDGNRIQVAMCESADRCGNCANRSMDRCDDVTGNNSLYVFFFLVRGHGEMKKVYE